MIGFRAVRRFLFSPSSRWTVGLVESVRLPDFPHADPADRIIAATALSLGAALVTKDDKLRDYRSLKTIW